MEFSGAQVIAAPLQSVWAFLLDVHKVARCAPDIQSLEELGPEHWKALLAVAVGPIKAKFALDITRPELHEPDLMVIRVYGKAPVGAVEFQGKIQLSAVDDDQTRMEWLTHVALSGMLAGVGTRLIQSNAEELAEQFFACLREQVQAS